MQCFACGRERALATGERIGFRDACDCGADLHVCRNCGHHDPAAYNECRESSAERVGERERGNRCEYFTPRAGRYAPGATAPGASAAKAALEGLFKKRP